MGTDNYQSRYWRELDQMKTHVYYVEEYARVTLSYDNGLNILIAIATSGSIATWAVWGAVPMLWASIIAVSQIINAIRPYLPYRKRLKALYGLSNELESLFIMMEDKWYNVSEGLLTDEEIHKLHIDFKKRRDVIMKKYLGDSILPEDPKLLEKSKLQAARYFNNFYPVNKEE